jgi:hypothetical protein
LIYGMIGKEVDCCVCTGWFSIYIHLKLFVFTCYCQVKKVNGSVLFVCGVEFGVTVYIVCVCVDGVLTDSCRVLYD